MADLYFDIASDLSDDLSIIDYFQFLIINDLISDTRYDTMGITRRVEYYIKVYEISHRWIRITNHVRNDGDLEVLKWIHKHNTIEGRIIFTFCFFIVPNSDELKHLAVIKWLYDMRMIHIEESTIRFIEKDKCAPEVREFIESVIKLTNTSHHSNNHYTANGGSLF